MAPITKSLALIGALFAAAGLAVPVKRGDAVVWETVTDVVWTTIDITTTIYPGQATAEPTVVPVTTKVSTPTSVAQAAPEETSSSSSSSSSSSEAPAQTTFAPVKAAVTQAPAVTSAPSTTLETSASSSSTSSSAASSSSSSSSSGHTGACSEGSPCTGDGTYYDTATTSTNPSSCGTTDDGISENVLALPVGIMQDSDCGKTVTIKYNGQTSTGKVVDKCMGCDNNSIDLSRHLFGELASLDEGRLSGVEWYIN